MNNRNLLIIDEKNIIHFLQKFIQINTENPPGNEKAGALFLAGKLEEIGCKVELQEVETNRPNVIGILEGKRPEKLLFNGHVDTVRIGNDKGWDYPPLGGVIHDGYVYGRGAADMKAGLVSMIFAMEALVKSGLPLERGLIFTGVIDEEYTFKGTRALLNSGKLDCCTLGYVSEPTNLQIATRLKGGIEYTAKTFGRNAHTGQAYLGENAVFRMARVISALEEYDARLRRSIHDKELRYPTCTVSTVHGGEGVTFVPDSCEILFDRQIFPVESMDNVREEIQLLFDRLRNELNIEIELKENQSFPPWKISGNSKPVRQLREAFREIRQEEPEYGILNGYAEVEMLSSAGIPSVLFGPGDDNTSHSYNERVKIEEVITAAEVYAAAARQFCCQ